LHKVLPISAVLVFLTCTAIAQLPLPASTQAHLGTLARLEALSLTDFAKVMSQAQSGDKEAQYLMALIYLEGRLVAKDFAPARSWMLMSAEQGYVPAQDGMGEMYLNNVRHEGPIPDYGEAERWLRLAATQDDADAQFWLGTGYQRGYFGAIDHREALKWLRKAAAQGLPLAQFCIGQMYQQGEALSENNSLADVWFRKAADHFTHVGDQPVGGVWDAEVELAYMHRDGRLPKYDLQAYLWFAIVDSSLDPPIDDDVKRAAQHMTKAQIARARHMAEDWTIRHTWRANVATSPDPTH
jgi:TPR repeat protein